MNITYTPHLDRAWQRMKTTLFGPLDLGKWFALGFTAWLAQLASGGGGGGSSSTRISNKLDRTDWHDWGSSTADTVRDFLSEGIAIVVVAFVVIVILVIAVVVLWISSRGRFMFLDNLVHDRSRVVAPWAEYRAEGNSLFLWQIGYTLIVMFVLGLLVAAGVLLFVPAVALELPAIATLPLAILTGTVAFIVIVALAYIEFFLNHFVVPVMYRERVACMAAWSRFLSLFKEHPGSFVAYGLLHLLIMIIGGLVFFVGGLLTCCVGLLLMVLPYIGTVVTLPLPVLSRFWDLEFLGQFGDDWRLLPLDPVPGDDPQPGPYPGPEPSSEPVDDGAQPLVEFDTDGTVIGPEDVGEDAGDPEPRSEDP